MIWLFEVKNESVQNQKLLIAVNWKVGEKMVWYFPKEQTWAFYFVKTPTLFVQVIIKSIFEVVLPDYFSVGGGTTYIWPIYLSHIMTAKTSNVFIHQKNYSQTGYSPFRPKQNKGWLSCLLYDRFPLSTSYFQTFCRRWWYFLAQQTTIRNRFTRFVVFSRSFHLQRLFKVTTSGVWEPKTQNNLQRDYKLLEITLWQAHQMLGSIILSELYWKRSCKTNILLQIRRTGV